ncbi:MAG: VIT1/CCC1 transporter family protein [Candidatus Woesearchaeota archaeon]
MKKKREKFESEHEKGKFIRHFVFGAEDGLISTLGFLTGIVGASLSHITIVIVGIAEVFAAALSMGIGTYLSTKSSVELIKRNIDIEKDEIKIMPKRERKEIEVMYRKKGFKGNKLKKIVDKIVSNKKVWLGEMLGFELGIVPGKYENPIKSAVIMFFTFIVLAFIPLASYLFVENVMSALFTSVVLTMITLFLVGAIKTKLTRKAWWKSGLEMMVLGLVAAIVTFYIGQFISGFY